MRLTPAQHQAITDTFLEVFGRGEIRLFSSRADDAKRGGDIDLYVTPDEKDNIAEKRISFLAKLKRRIGVQKIDLVISASPCRPIDLIAQREGILICRKH